LTRQLGRVRRDPGLPERTLAKILDRRWWIFARSAADLRSSLTCEPDTDADVLGDHHDFERPRVTKRSRLQARTTDSSSFGP
jgi:hypothetical protein